MKKIIKIVSLLLFVLLVFGITTSNAANQTVFTSTDADTMIGWLNNGHKLTGISNSVRKGNRYLYCRQHGQPISSSAVYSKSAGPIYFPGLDSMGYAKAYILASERGDENTSNGSRQKAWWKILNQLGVEETVPNLYYEALKYQEYKTAENLIPGGNGIAQLSTTPTITMQGNYLYYGPIKINYAYSYCEQSNYHFGGFDYAFFEGESPIDSGVTLLHQKDDGTYENIVNSGRLEQYYKVRTSLYNRRPLYIKVDLNTVNVSTINFKIRKNRVKDYSAEIYELTGHYNVSGSRVYCLDCQDNFEDFTVMGSVGWHEEGRVYTHNEKYYKFMGQVIRYEYTGLRETYNEINLDGTITYTSGQVSPNTTKYYLSNGRYKSLDDCAVYIPGGSINSGKYYCSICHKNCTNGTADFSCVCEKFDNKDRAKLHIENRERTDSSHRRYYRYDIKVLNFVSYYGCDNRMDFNGNPVECGDRLTGSVESQQLFISNPNEASTPAEVNIDIDIPLTTSINITKVWNDYPDGVTGNKEITRPRSIKVNVYKTTNASAPEDSSNSSWTLERENVEITSANNWTTTISGLPRIDGSGNTYYYMVKEVDVPKYYTVTYSSGSYSQGRVADTDNKAITITNQLEYVNINVTKRWNDYNNNYNIRPGSIELIVKRSTNQTNWDTVDSSKYNVTWTSDDSTEDDWTATITGLVGVNASGQRYYYKVEEANTENILAYYVPQYGNSVQYTRGNHNINLGMQNDLRTIVLSGYVWLDGQTGIKPARPHDGIMQDTEAKMAGIKVYLLYDDPETPEVFYSQVEDASGVTTTDEYGRYKFEGYEIGRYMVKFEYDGINYEDTIRAENGSAKAFEDNISETQRGDFNGRFATIEQVELDNGTKQVQSNYGTTLEYSYSDSDRKSTLITYEEGIIPNDVQETSDGKKYIETGTVIQTPERSFVMNAATTGALYTSNAENLNLGLVKRGTDIALSSDVYKAEVKINGQTTEYTYSGDGDLKLVFDAETGEQIIGNAPTSQNPNAQYSLKLRKSDYNYRIRDYVSHNRFIENDYINSDIPDDVTTGDELDVCVIYKIRLQNQSTNPVQINKVAFNYYDNDNDDDYDYTVTKIYNGNTEYRAQGEGNTKTIDLQGLELAGGNTATIYIKFHVDKEPGTRNVETGDFAVKAEIISYSTSLGLIDVDSQPGNFMETINNDSPEVEDDNDIAGGLEIEVVGDMERTITGKVFAQENEQEPVNDVIVQLIELKEKDGKVYEYIWQETRSGSGTGLKTPMTLNSDGSITELENYSYTAQTGEYVFSGYIPGNYIVRFIYGDGEKVLVGDINSDMRVNEQDRELLYNHVRGIQILTEEQQQRADFNGDGEVDNGDMSIFYATILNKSQIKGDVNCDYALDWIDNDLVYKYDKKELDRFSDQGMLNADMNGDGRTNVVDVAELYWLFRHNPLIKYNGQDYKSVADIDNYSKEWYDLSLYENGASVARDNEARRLETMMYSLEIDASKGLLLKLLDNPRPNELNETEKETFLDIYNGLYNPDIESVDDITDELIYKLLVDQVLENTWMCAETSKICVPVETETDTIENSGTPAGVSVASSYSDINLGLEKRPETKIELKKYITGFKLTAVNGQTLVNAVLDINKYLDGTDEDEISGEVQGIKDSVTILGTVWQYEVAPTEINTIIEGATLEFEYTLVVENTGETDYLSDSLARVYSENSLENYRSALTTGITTIKGNMRRGKYNNYTDSDGNSQDGIIGTYLGRSYYAGGEGTGKVLTEVTSIRDYINNELTFISGKNEDGTNIAPPDDSSKVEHRILRDDFSLQPITVNTITTGATGKMLNDGTIKIYKVSLGKDNLSSTGDLDFENYIAEVMSYTNAAGRRATEFTPGNAEIIDHERRKDSEGNELHHEIDEAETAEIKISAATGEDGQTNCILIISIVAGIALVAAGAFAVKKYVIK